MSHRPGGRSILVSLAIHGLVLVPVVVFARPPEPMQFETIRLNLVDLPPSAMEAEPAVVEAQRQPEPEQPEPEPETTEPEPEPQQPEPEPEAEQPPPPKPPEKKPEPAPPEEREPAPETPRPTKTPPEEPTTEQGGDGVRVNVEGLKARYPEYFSNIVRQIYRYFRWTGETRPTATVRFEVLKDGSVRNISIVKASGNLKFDFDVQGAVESAGNRRAFGPLPEDYQGAFLPIELEIEPPR